MPTGETRTLLELPLELGRLRSLRKSFGLNDSVSLRGTQFQNLFRKLNRSGLSSDWLIDSKVSTCESFLLVDFHGNHVNSDAQVIVIGSLGSSLFMNLASA